MSGVSKRRTWIGDLSEFAGSPNYRNSWRSHIVTKQVVDVAYMRPLFPAFIEWLKKPETLDQFAEQGKKINWNWVNEVERQCSLQQTPCPQHVAAGQWDLTDV